MPLLVASEKQAHKFAIFTDHALLPNYQYEIGLFKKYLKTFGCPSQILHISIVSLLGLTITSREIENKEYYGIFEKGLFLHLFVRRHFAG